MEPPTKRYRDDEFHHAPPAHSEASKEPSRVLHVTELNPRVTEADLLEAFGAFGAINYTVVKRFRYVLGLVEFEEVESAVMCVTASANNAIFITGSESVVAFSSLKEIPRHGFESSKPNHVLVLTVYNVNYMINATTLKEICSPHGQVLRVAIVKKAHTLVALVEFQSADVAKVVKRNINGADIYSGCCTLKVEYASVERVRITVLDADHMDFTVPKDDDTGRAKERHSDRGNNDTNGKSADGIIRFPSAYAFSWLLDGEVSVPPLDGEGFVSPLDGDVSVPPLDGVVSVPPPDGVGYSPSLYGEVFVPPPDGVGPGLAPDCERYSADLPLDGVDYLRPLDDEVYFSSLGDDVYCYDKEVWSSPSEDEMDFPLLERESDVSYSDDEDQFSYPEEIRSSLRSEPLKDNLLLSPLESEAPSFPYNSPYPSGSKNSSREYYSLKPLERKRKLNRKDERRNAVIGTPSLKRAKAVDTVAKEFRAGGVHRKRNVWLSLEPTILTREFICNGYFIPFMTTPTTSMSCRNRKSAERHADFVSEQITGLVRTGAVEEVEENECQDKISCISPLSVAEGKKLRLVLDLSELNKSVAKHHFKLEDARTVLPCLPEGGFLACFDLKSGYHHLLIAEKSRKYLGFRWEEKLFRFAALPFGLSSAPFAFTKLLRTLVRKWRGEGLGCCLYLDDGLIWGATRESCIKAVRIIRKDLEDFGFTCAEEKCTWEPTQRLTWLGFEFDLSENTVALSGERWEKSKERLNYLIVNGSPTLRDRLKWTGTMASMEILFDKEEKRNSREATATVARLQERGLRLDRKERASDRERNEWLWWRSRIERRPCRAIVAAPEQNHANTIILTDASETGVGAVLKHPRYDVKTFAELPDDLLGTSSTLRELFGIVFGLGALTHRIKGDIIVKTDNWAAANIWKSGSMKPHLQDMAKRIWNLEQLNKWNLRVDWIPRALNSEADAASREIDYDDWRIRQSVATRIQREWGHCEIDLFANDRNSKCPRFVSRWPCPGSRGEDAFSRDGYWTSGSLWLVPPVKLIPRALAFAVRLGAKGILGIPLWTGQPFYPMLIDEQGNWMKEIKKSWHFSPGDLLFDDTSFSKTFDTPETKVPFVFLKFDFSKRAVANRL